MDIVQVQFFKTILSVSALCMIAMSCLSQANSVCNYEIESNNDAIIINKWNWGVNGNNQLIAISDRKLSKPDEANSDNDYLFEGSFPIFVKLRNDTLLVYTYKKAMIPDQSTLNNVKVVQIEIDNSMNMQLRSDLNYLNLERICLD